MEILVGEFAIAQETLKGNLCVNKRKKNKKTNNL